MPRFDKATYLFLLFKFILSERLSNSLSGSDLLLLDLFLLSFKRLSDVLRAFAYASAIGNL